MASSRARREKKTVSAMVGLYCHAHHCRSGKLCAECSELLEYAISRIDRCPMIGNKPTCAKCHIHCYEPGKREKIRAVMRYSGPRMMTRHPVLAIRHLIDGKRRKLVHRK